MRAEFDSQTLRAMKRIANRWVDWYGPVGAIKQAEELVKNAIPQSHKFWAIILHEVHHVISQRVKKLSGIPKVDANFHEFEQLRKNLS
jgi:hypothetical protein